MRASATAGGRLQPCRSMAALPPPPGAAVAAFDVVAWAQALALGPEDTNADAGSTVYLVTFARVLNQTLAAAPQLRDVGGLSRTQVRDAVADALENPESAHRRGRPRAVSPEPLVLKALVVREAHSDGSHHYHVAVKLRVNQRFSAAKRTLVSRHGLPSHWSTGHTQWFSAVRYCVYTSPKKTEVDKDRLVWAAPGHDFDPFEDAQEPFNAKAWTKRRPSVNHVAQ